MFKQNYLSRIIHYNMQDIFWEHNPDHNFTKAVSQIDCLKDSDKLKKLSKKQDQQV